MYNSCIVLCKVPINTLHNKLNLFHSMVYTLGTLRKVWIKQTGLCFLGSQLMLRSHVCIAMFDYVYNGSLIVLHKVMIGSKPWKCLDIHMGGLLSA